MKLTALPSGLSPWNQKTILPAALALALLGPSPAWAQEAEGLEDDSAEGDSAEDDSTQGDEGGAEVEGDEAVDDSGDEAPDDADPASASDDESSEASSEESTEAAEPEPEPEPEEPADPVGTQDEPDYFGSYEPLNAPMSTELEMPKKPPYSGPFRGGAFRVGLGIGGGGYGDQTYLILGGGLGYFLINGLELHFDTDFWLIGDPFIATPTPGVRYVMWFIPKVHPYVGGFFRHYVVGSGYQDADSVGARGGVYLMTGRSSYFGLGIVYEHMLQDHLFVETDFWYPEITFAFAF